MTTGIWTRCETLESPMPEKPTPARADDLGAARHRLVVAEHRLGVANYNLDSLDDSEAETDHLDRRRHWSRHQEFATTAVEAANLEVARQIDDQKRLGGAAVERIITLAAQVHEVVNE